MKNEEQQLLNLIRAGNEEAFKKIFYLYSDRFFTWAYKITQRVSVAEDIVQDFFVRYWEKRETLVFNPSFSAYAYRSIYNASLNYIRDNERFIYGFEEIIECMSPEAEDCELQELESLLIKAIETLPDRCKKIFIMATLENKKYTEIADLLGISVNTVKVQVSKAYNSLKKNEFIKKRE